MNFIGAALELQVANDQCGIMSQYFSSVCNIYYFNDLLTNIVQEKHCLATNTKDEFIDTQCLGDFTADGSGKRWCLWCPTTGIHSSIGILDIIFHNFVCFS